MNTPSAEFGVNVNDGGLLCDRPFTVGDGGADPADRAVMSSPTGDDDMVDSVACRWCRDVCCKRLKFDIPTSKEESSGFFSKTAEELSSNDSFIVQGANVMITMQKEKGKRQER